jgi:extradiol dioxygenase family protein
VPVDLNHTIVPARDKHESAAFLAEVLGLAAPKSVGPFVEVETSNGVSLDLDDRWEVASHHYAFLVSEDEFDAIFARIKDRNIRYWADPGHQQPDMLNNNGRGFYFEDPSGHNMEVLTRPYGA